MAKKIFSTDDNMLVVEEITPPTDKPKMATTFSVKSKRPAEKVKTEELVATAFSYQNTGMEVLEAGEGKDCIFCGTRTSFDNRYVCPQCWAEKKNIIYNAVIENIKGNQVEIE